MEKIKTQFEQRWLKMVSLLHTTEVQKNYTPLLAFIRVQRCNNQYSVPEHLLLHSELSLGISELSR